MNGDMNKFIGNVLGSEDKLVKLLGNNPIDHLVGYVYSMDFREAKIRRAEAALARLGRLGGRAGWAIHAVPQPEYGQARGESR